MVLSEIIGWIGLIILVIGLLIAVISIFIRPKWKGWARILWIIAGVLWTDLIIGWVAKTMNIGSGIVFPL